MSSSRFGGWSRHPCVQEDGNLARYFMYWDNSICLPKSIWIVGKYERCKRIPAREQKALRRAYRRELAMMEAAEKRLNTPADTSRLVICQDPPLPVVAL